MNSMLQILKNNDSDLEWYPTTQEIIDIILNDVKSASRSHTTKTVLDVGAGDGRVLKAFKNNDKLNINEVFGIEKAYEQVAVWRDITFIGSDFYNSNISHRSFDITFCNPPFKQYEQWVSRIISEVSSSVIYFVIPKRWVNSQLIKSALTKKGLSYYILGEYDFNDGDRQARTTVNVIRVYNNVIKNILDSNKDENRKKLFINSLGISDHENGFILDAIHNHDPMASFFETHFPNLAQVDEEVEDDDDHKNELIGSKNTLVNLIALHDRDMQIVYDNYKQLDKLDRKLFQELHLNLKSIKQTLYNKMVSIKGEYWKLFIDNYNPITNRLTQKYRDLIYSKVIDLAKNIDFNYENAFAVTNMVISYANDYMEEQVLDFYKNLSNPESIVLYKSNKRVFSKDDWRYNKASHYKLDYRIIRHRLFSITTNFYSVKLNDYEIKNVVNDICVIARLVGMKVNPNILDDYNFDVSLGESLDIEYDYNGKVETLFKIKFFKNGNQHLFLNKEFALRLNVCMGKMKGWVKDKNDAYYEMGSDFKENVFNEIYDDVNVMKLDFSETNLLLGN